MANMAKMKFQLGDYVRYTNKREKLDFVGTIVSADPNYGEYLILPEDHLKGAMKMYRSSSEEGTWLKNHFSHAGRSLEPVVWASSKSRSMRYAELMYDPTQEPDDEDDI
jgi:hypothetical protein